MISCSKGDLSIDCISSLGWVKGEDKQEVLHLSCILLKRALYQMQISIYKYKDLYDLGISEKTLASNCKTLLIIVDESILNYLDYECYITDSAYTIGQRIKEGLNLYKEMKGMF